MSKKIVTDALGSPSLIGNLRDHSKDLIDTTARRAVLVFVSGLFLVLQYVGMSFTPTSTNSSNAVSDNIYGGVSTKQDVLLEYDARDSEFRKAADTFSIPRDNLEKMNDDTLQNWGNTKPSLLVAWSKSPVYKVTTAEKGEPVNNSSFLATSQDESALYYGHLISKTALERSDTPILSGYSAETGHFAIIKSNGNLITSNYSADICYKKPNDLLSYTNCPNSNSIKTQTSVTNIGYKSDAKYLKNRAGDRLQYDMLISNGSDRRISLKPELYIGDILEYSKLTNVDAARFNDNTQTLQWESLSLDSGASKRFSFSVQLLDSMSLGARGLSNTSSYDCYITSYFGGTTDIKLYCPTPKVIERMLSLPPSTSLLALSWIVFVVNIFIYTRSYILAKEHGLILKKTRKKHG